MAKKNKISYLNPSELYSGALLPDGHIDVRTTGLLRLNPHRLGDYPKKRQKVGQARDLLYRILNEIQPDIPPQKHNLDLENLILKAATLATRYPRHEALTEQLAEAAETAQEANRGIEAATIASFNSALRTGTEGDTEPLWVFPRIGSGSYDVDISVGRLAGMVFASAGTERAIYPLLIARDGSQGVYPNPRRDPEVFEYQLFVQGPMGRWGDMKKP